MLYYPQYNINNFYDHYYNGGLHLFQVQFLYEGLVKKENEDRKFLALIHGIDVDKPKSGKNDKQTQPKNQSLPIFGDPAEYKHLSEEEKNELTKNMMSKHQFWANKQTQRTKIKSA